MQFSDKIVLVTGGGSGIGQATALAFAREGAKVVVTDVDKEGGQATVNAIRKAGGETMFIAADVSKSADVQAMIKQSVELYGRLDCAFNNAGIAGPLGISWDAYPEAVWERVIGINLTGVWLCMKYELQQMRKQGGGTIVNTASIMGLVGTEPASYCASKHGVIGLTKSAALTYAKEGIRINAICPGFIETPLLDPITSNNPQVATEIAARHPIGRMGKPAEIAETVLWLCSNAASFVTGHAMVVDGGYIAQ